MGYQEEQKLSLEYFHRKWLKPRVVIWTGPAWEPWTRFSVEKGMAGSETWAAYLAEEFARLGYDVTIYGHLDDPKAQLVLNGVTYADHRRMIEDLMFVYVDLFISSRNIDIVTEKIHALKTYIMIHDIWLHPDQKHDMQTWRVNRYYYLSDWHKGFIKEHHASIPEEKLFKTSNGIPFEYYSDHHMYTKCNMSVYSSSPDRGLLQLLECMPDIRKAVPDFKLLVCYGFHNWESAAKLRNDHVSLKLIERIKALIEQPGVIYKGRVSKQELAAYQMGSKVWLYPSWFTETHCCPPGTQITTDKDLKNIESIPKGTLVLTHTGSLKPVINTFVHEVDEDINTIKVKYLMDSLRITDKHNVMILKKDSESLHCVRIQHSPCTKRALKCEEGHRVRKGYYTKKDCWKKTEGYKTEWIPAGLIEKGDYVLYPKNKKAIIPGMLSEYCRDSVIDGYIVAFVNGDRKYIDKDHKSKKYWISKANRISDFKIDEEFLKFCGWYISEGFCSATGTVSFSLNKKEINEANFLSSYGKKLGLNPWVYNSKDSESMVVSMSSAILSRFLSDNFGCGSKHVSIPQWCKDLPKDMLRYLLVGIFQGDGCFIRAVCKIEVASKQLIVDLFDVLLKFGCVSSTAKTLKPKVIRVKTDGKVKYVRGEKILPEYSLVVSVSQNTDLFKFIGFDAKEKKSTGQAALQDESYAYLPVASNTKERYIGPVYNIEVADDNTYVANNIIVHNCITAIENKAAKNAIITTDLGGLKDTVGDAGVLLPPQGLSREEPLPEEYKKRFIEEAVRMLTDEEYRLSWVNKTTPKSLEQYQWSEIVKDFLT